MANPRVVAITGASSGIGHAAAVRFAQDGWRVGLIARGGDTLDQVRKDVVEAGGTACVAIADVADSAALEVAAAEIEAVLGPIDVWVNNAGIGIFGFFMDTPEAEFRTVTDTNYLGTVNGTRVALRRMQPRNRGAIVQVASTLSYRAVPLQSPYCGSKFAIRGFTEALRSELKHQNSAVHLTMVHPPAVNTPFYNHAQSHMPKPVRPPPPIYQPEIVADAILYAATHRRREVKVGEATLVFAIGNKFVPELMDWVAGKVGVALQQSDAGPTSPIALRDTNLHQAGRTGGMHGPFDAESLPVSPQMWANKNLGVLAVGAGLVAMALLARPRR